MRLHGLVPGLELVLLPVCCRVLLISYADGEEERLTETGYVNGLIAIRNLECKQG